MARGLFPRIDDALIGTPGTSRGRSRLDLVNYFAIGVVASALADMTHEALGHLVAARLSGVEIVSLSTVAVQTGSESRLVAGAGTTANLVVGALALIILNLVGKAGPRRASASVFLWLFAAFNLLNCGYLVVSAVTASGDWAVVVKDLTPILLWRILLGAVGATLYVRSVHWLRRSAALLVARGAVTATAVRRFVIAGYVAGGVVMTGASLFNPIGPQLIVVSGIGASFGLFAGVLLIPASVKQRVSTNTSSEPAALSVAWITAAVIVGAAFLGIFGPGIFFSG